MIPERVDRYLREHHPAFEHSSHLRAVAAQRLAAAEHVTGAPRRSTPKSGKACTLRPSSIAARARRSEATTVPWPPRPCRRTWVRPPPRVAGRSDTR